jgi:membrane fusion protein (multidrug efflux system)
MYKTLVVLAIIMLIIFVVTSAGCTVDATTAAQNDSESVAEGAEDTQGESGEDDEEVEEEEAVPVEVASLTQGSIESVLRFSSSLEVESRVEVFSQAKRLVTELLVEEGDHVERNQLLARLQSEEQESALAKVESELARAEREFRRQERLRDQELISEQAFTDAKFNLEQLQISVEDARRELSYTEVRAPIAGTITARSVNLGDQVQIGQQLFEMMDFDTMVARVFVPEKHLPELRPGLDVRITAAGTGGREFAGKVQRIAPVVDAKSGTVKVTVAIGGQRDLRPGLYVDVDLVTATHRDAVLVPKRAVVYDNDQMFVYRLGDESRVERVYIEPRLTDKNHIEPADGLLRGDRVVIAGQAGLKDAALVELPLEELAEADDGADEVVEVSQRAAS